MNYYNEHNIKPVAVNFEMATDTIAVTRDMHLEQISKVLNLPLAEMKALNPQYRSGVSRRKQADGRCFANYQPG
ncbi:MAG: hypothetical protein R2744_06620 [Bacteroidales bacterium]